MAVYTMPVPFSSMEAVAPEVTMGASFDPVIANAIAEDMDVLPAVSTIWTVPKPSLVAWLAVRDWVAAVLLLRA